MEIKIWRVPASAAYPAGVKYRMALVAWDNGKVLLLFDNHSPKGSHVHREGREEPYEFSGVKKLRLDFQRAVNEEIARLREDQKN